MRRLAAVALALAACGGGVKVQTIAGAPADVEDEPESARWTDAPVVGVATSSAEVVVATADGAMLVVGTTLAPMEVVVQGESPASTGAVRWLSPWGHSLVVGGEEGLFYASGTRLLHSPASSAVAGLEVTAVAPTEPDVGDEPGLWIGTAADVVHLQDERLTRWDIAEAAGVSSTHVTALAAGAGRVVVAYGETVVEFDPASSTADDVPIELGAISDAGADVQGNVYLAGPRGVGMRSADGSWSHFTLADEGNASAVAVAGRPGGGFHTVVDASPDPLLVTWDPDEDAPRVDATLAGSVEDARLAVDSYGHLWLSAADELSAYYVGEPVSFETELSAFFDEVCNTCHQDDGSGAPQFDAGSFDDALERGEAILSRVQSGSMPPPNSGLALTPEELQLVDRWVATGMAP